LVVNITGKPDIITHVALTGYTACGKSTLGGILRDYAAYRHIATDDIRDELFGGKSPLELTGDEWSLLYSELGASKTAYILGGENVATENCAFSDANRRMIMHVSPVLAKCLKGRNQMLRRVLVQLDADVTLIRKRTEEMGRGQEFQDYIDWLNLFWTCPGDLSDRYGPVEVFRYDNESQKDLESIQKDLGSKLGIRLL
jgi:predicted kinase